MRKDNQVFSETPKRRIYKFIIEPVGSGETLPKNDPFCRIPINQLLKSEPSMEANKVNNILDFIL